MSGIFRNLVSEIKTLLIMDMNNANYCVILAGGRGRRLWPYSRKNEPKQFLDFFGCGRTLLQSTFDRFARIMPKENIYVCTNAEFAGTVAEQLPDLPAANIIAEPVSRNTAPSVALADVLIYKRDADARVIITPSDMLVMNDEAFTSNVLQGLDFVAESDMLLTMGVKPTRPEPGYGYIQAGEPTGAAGVYKVQSFTEKPERDFARMFMESGEFYWNTGLFLSNVRYLGQSLSKLFPEQMDQFIATTPGGTLRDSHDYLEKQFSSFPNLSIDYGILERSENVCVMICDFGWADIGTWHSVYECMRRSDGENVVIDSDVILDDCRNNVIKLDKGKLAVINGLDGYIVAEKDNVLFICKKGDSSALVRKYVNETQIRYGEDFV